MHRAGIYAIVHVLSGQRYVGQTNSFERRWEQHREALIAGNHHNPRLQALWRADSELAFEFVEVEVAPAYLQPIQLQKWLQKKEHELIRTYKAKGQAFNIVDAELVETRAAQEAALAPPVSASSRIHEELRVIKSQVAAAEAAVRTSAKVLTDAQAQLLAAEVSRNRSVGFFRALFGRTDRPVDLENDRQVTHVKGTVAMAARELTMRDTELQALLERRKDLHNSYSGNVRRAAVRRRAWSMF